MAANDPHDIDPRIRAFIDDVRAQTAHVEYPHCAECGDRHPTGEQVREQLLDSIALLPNAMQYLEQLTFAQPIDAVTWLVARCAAYVLTEFMDRGVVKHHTKKGGRR